MHGKNPAAHNGYDQSAVQHFGDNTPAVSFGSPRVFLFPDSRTRSTIGKQASERGKSRVGHRILVRLPLVRLTARAVAEFGSDDELAGREHHMNMRLNRLLTATPPEVYERLKPKMKIVDLPRGLVLHRPSERIKSVYFPLTCLISVTVTMRNGQTSEAGIVGSREMVGINAFMGGSETNQTEYVAQVPGHAVQLKAELLVAEFDRSKGFRDLLLRYTQAYIAQLSQNVACNRQHNLRQRLCRWLLESRDRLQFDKVPLTHEFIGEMLGVRRASVSVELAAIRESGIVTYRRQSITVVDSQKLQTESCECYALVLDEYDRLLGDRAVEI